MNLNRILTEATVAGKDSFIHLHVDFLVILSPHFVLDMFYCIKTDMRSTQDSSAAGKSGRFDRDGQHKVEGFLALARTNFFFYQFLTLDIKVTSAWTFMKKRPTKLRDAGRQKTKTPSGADGDALRWMLLCNTNIMACSCLSSFHPDAPGFQAEAFL